MKIAEVVRGAVPNKSVSVFRYVKKVVGRNRLILNSYSITKKGKTNLALHCVIKHLIMKVFGMLEV
jgi:hypothetical protein